MTDQTGQTLSPVALTWLGLICRCQNPDGWHACYAQAVRLAALGQPTAREREVLAVLR